VVGMVVSLTRETRPWEVLGEEEGDRVAQRRGHYPPEPGPREEVEDLVGAAADEVESVKGKGRPSSLASTISPVDAPGTSTVD